jgi:hypothetical protein
MNQPRTGRSQRMACIGHCHRIGHQAQRQHRIANRDSAQLPVLRDSNAR